MFYNPLVLLVLGPIAGGVICLALPERAKIFIKTLAFLICLSAFVETILVFLKKPLAYNIVYNAGPEPLLLADNLSGFIALVIALFALLITIYSFGFIKKSFGRYFGYVLITLGSAMGAALAVNFISLCPMMVITSKLF